jgi:basic amino acid/polyamine antiporter, APA family
MDHPTRKTVPLSAAIAIVVGNMVGTGVFTSLAFQVTSLPSAFPILLLWTLGGVLAFCGAVNYAELAAAFPRSGGEYGLLTQAYHPGVGFVAGWISLTVGFPAPVAAAALTFGRYVAGIGDADSVFLVRATAAGIIALVTGVHLVSLHTTGRFQTILTAIKFSLVAILALSGLFLGSSQAISFLPQAGDSQLILSTGFYVSLIYVLYAYSGWNAASYITSEIENPNRNVPRAFMIGTAVVTVLYVALNAAMLRAAPIEEMADKPEVALVAAQHVYGETGGRWMGALIAFALVSTLSAMMWAGPRVAQQMGMDFPALRFLGTTTERGVPTLAVLLQALLAIVLVFSSEVDQLILRTTLCLEIVLLVTIWAVVHLRYFRPEMPRPFRAWGYPFTTFAFLIMIGITMAFLLRERPRDVEWSLGLIAIGAVTYFLVRPRGGSK